MTRRDALESIVCAACVPNIAATGAAIADADSAAITPYDFGAAGNGRTDDTQALRAAIRAAASQGKVLDLLRGTYRVTGSCVAEGDLRLINSGGAVIHAARGRYADVGALVVRGTASRMPGIAASVAAGDLRLPLVNAAGFSQGDIGTIYDPADGSFSKFRSYYRAGEFFEVVSANDNALELRRPLYAGYAARAVDIYRVNSVSGYLHDIVITSDDGPSSLIYVDYARAFEIRSPTLRHANNDCILINRSIDCQVTMADVANEGDGDDDYGVVWANCQNCRTTGGTIYARRHPVAHGGSDQVNSVPCRGMVIHGDTKLSNDPASGTHSVDFHGNSEDCSVENCTIFGGVGVGGKGVRLRNNVIHSMANGIAVLGIEVVGGQFEIRNCTLDIRADPQAVTRGVIDFGGNSVAIDGRTTEDLTIIVDGARFASSALGPDSRLLNIRNRGGRRKVNIEFSSNQLDVNDFGIAVYMDIIAATGAAASSDFIVIDGNASSLKGKLLMHRDGDYSALPTLRRDRNDH